MKKRIRLVFLSLLIFFQGFALFPNQALAIEGYQQPVYTKNVRINGSVTPETIQTLDIPNIKAITQLTVDNGFVDYDLSGDTITLNLSGGEVKGTQWNPNKYSKTETDQKTSSSDSFTSSIAYSDESGYSGTLTKDGSSYVASGSDIPEDSKTATDTRVTSVGGSAGSLPASVSYSSDGYAGTLSTSGSAYVSSGSYSASDSMFVTAQTSPNYNSGGYTGTLSSYVYSGSYTPAGTPKEIIQVVGHHTHGNFELYPGDSLDFEIPYTENGVTIMLDQYDMTLDGGGGSSPPGPQMLYLWYKGTWQQPAVDTRVYKYQGTVTKPASDTRVWTQNYSGTVTKPASDTRIWKQDYSGTVYKGEYENLYEYDVEFQYVLKLEPPQWDVDQEEPTNQDVTVTIYYPDDSSVKEYKLNDGEWLPYESPVIVPENLSIYARSSDGINYSNTVSLVIDNIDKAPPSVNAPTATADSTNQITVTPDAADDATGLHEASFLYNRDGEDVGSWTAESFVDTELTPNTQYHYKYKARDSVGNESDYSEEVQRYTLALDPIGVEITTSTTESITLNITNNEQNEEPPETLIEVRLKSDGTVIATSDWSAEIERVLDGLNLDTEYELWVKARNGDRIENEFLKMQDSFYSNRQHHGSLTEPSGDRMITDHEAFTLSGRAWDLDRDKLIVSATVGESEKTFELTDTPSEEPDANNWFVSFTGDDLPNGSYNLISIKIKDGKGEEIDIPFNYTLTVAVTRIVKVEIEPGTLEIPVGQTMQLLATAYYSNGITNTNSPITEGVIWSSSSPENISVDNHGKIIGVAKGNATISANFEGKVATAEITVTDPVITSIEVQPERTVNLGNAFTLTAMATYSDGTEVDVTRQATWLSLNPEISVVNHGTVIGRSLGKTTVQAELEGVIGRVQVEVTPAIVKTVNLEPDQSQLQRGESLSLKAMAHYSDNKMVNVTNVATWSSLNPEIASVDGTGKVIGISEGKAIIQAGFEGKLATAEIIVISLPNSEPSGSSDLPTPSKPIDPTPTTPPAIPAPETPKPTVPVTTVPENIPDEPNPQTPIDEKSKTAETTPTKPKPSNASERYATSQAAIQKGNQVKGTMKDNSLLNIPTKTTEIGVVKGYVKDRQGNPIADARIELHSTPRVTYTDNKGFFQFANVEMGAHRIYLADESISKDLVLLNSITVREGGQVKSMTGDQVANALGEKGIVETAQVQLSANDSLKELEIIVDMNSKVKGKWFGLASLFPENFFSTENLLAGIGLSGSLLTVFVLSRFSRNTFIYVGLKCIQKRRAKLTQGELTLNLQKEFLKANGDNLKIVFSKSLSRKLAEKSITIIEAGKVVTRLISPEFAGKPLEIEVETLGE
ncbi:Ig-like domain-containing protein [Desulfosporosinus lacus]|uniref:Ig-like domain (Group 2) n=1 Tax=Desulfosporosinus lacus DSM 15449 TaxID=1121420 RepID=A0A1M5Q9Z4_9FIRM|nr:Ig-like domain-containing protein [Desulfosporosinus lacus]SHH10611.1 Ig-like domain (group 2) [Desulfosporosinus lacus DSM 15449]